MNTISSYALLSALILSCSILNAQSDSVLASYPLDGTIEPTTTPALSATSLLVGPGVTGVFPDFSSLSVDGSSLLFLNAGFNSITQEGAIDTQRYLAFSTSSATGYLLDLSRLTFSTLRLTDGDSDSGLGAPSSYALWINAQGLEAVVESGSIPGNTTDEFSRIEIDLTHFPELQEMSGPVEFRLYLWASEGLATPSERQIRFDDILLVGKSKENVTVPITEGDWKKHIHLGWIYVLDERPNWVFVKTSHKWLYLPNHDGQDSAGNWFHAPN